jgi:hypothetical protein
MKHINPPVDFRLKGSGSWENLVTRRDKYVPEGWAAATKRAAAGAEH